MCFEIPLYMCRYVRLDRVLVGARDQVFCAFDVGALFLANAWPSADPRRGHYRSFNSLAVAPDLLARLLAPLAIGLA